MEAATADTLAGTHWEGNPHLYRDGKTDMLSFCVPDLKKRVQRTTVHPQLSVDNQDNTVQYPQPNIVENADHGATSEDEEMASTMGQQPNKPQATGKSGKQLPNPPTNIKTMKDTNVYLPYDHNTMLSSLHWRLPHDEPSPSSNQTLRFCVTSMQPYFQTVSSWIRLPMNSGP